MDNIQNFNYHIIPIKTKTPWLLDHRVFYFQLGKRHRHQTLIQNNYEEIKRISSQNRLSFIFHKYLIDSIHQMNNTHLDYDFIKEIACIDAQNFYDELEWQIFTYQVIDPVYIVRKYNETSLIAWGYDSFKKGKRGLRFPFESLLSIDNIVIGEYCQLNPYSDDNWTTNTEYMALKIDKTRLSSNK
ncbi:hypothetical protein [Sphingobacterium hotanense]|uniref:DUF2441 domain-containing protein n=1 Tax=Sphingobacterium hotanense TaxID=649196 RepID=A0ABT7NT67_9SPHI|nr:hypothetical protein [Sphingobacterium hotanense]MDM1050389.1 hypothetical protein [Sphingobacterium hotanense]